MANVKTRLKAHKSATNKRGRGNTKKSLAGVKNAVNTTATRTKCDATKEQSNGNVLLIENSVQQLLNKETVLSKEKNIDIQSQHSSNSEERRADITRDYFKSRYCLVTRSGRIRKRNKGDIRHIEILKSELMIEDCDRDSTLRNTPKKNLAPNIINNNDLELSDQNSTVGTTTATPESCDESDINEPEDVQRESNSNVNVQNKNYSKSTKEAKNDVNTPVERRKRVNGAINNKTDLKNPTRKKRKLENNTVRKTIAKTKRVDAKKTKQVTLSNGLVLTLSLFQCDHCNKSFTSKSSIRRHMYTHLKLKLYSCPHCSKKFCYQLNYRNHLEKFHSDHTKIPDVYECHICNKTFLLSENLNLHLSTHIKNENSYKCIYCDKKFSYHLLLEQHEKQHLAVGGFQCRICNMSFECRNRLSMHVKSHLKIKDYICQYCGKEFLRLNSMRRHVQICHGGHRIVCPICKKKLKGHLTEHMRTHEKRRPHECPECGQCFTQSTQLTVHRRSHTGARPYLCRICDRPFSHSNALMLHIRRHTGEKPFPCAMCPLSFSQLPHMKAHMRKIHGKENPYKCIKCAQFFKLKAQLEVHSKTCTVGDRVLSFEEQIEASVKYEEIEVESVMNLSRMRFLLALLLTMIATKDKLKYLGFNKRLIDDLLVESLEAMGQTPCKDESLTPLKRLKANIEMLLIRTVPKQQMEKFQRENKTTEELLELLTDEKRVG